MILGIFVILIGVVVFLKNLGLIELPTSFWLFTYPLLIIVIGVYLTIGARKGKYYGHWIVKKFSKDKDQEEQ